MCDVFYVATHLTFIYVTVQIWRYYTQSASLETQGLSALSHEEYMWVPRDDS